MRILTFLVGILCVNEMLYANGFRDDFDFLNKDYWYVTRVDGDWKSNSLDYDAVEISDGIINLPFVRTDDGPILTSKALKVSNGDIVTIKRKVYVHAANTYYTGGLVIFSTNDAGHSSTANSEQNRFSGLCGIRHTNYSHQGNWNAFILGDRNDESNLIAPLWDEWLEEEFVYDTATGIATYSANGETVTTQCEVSDRDYIKIHIDSFGWHTGHFEKMDYFEVSISGNASCASSDGYTKTDIDNAIEQGKKACINNPASCGISTSGGDTPISDCMADYSPVGQLHVPCVSVPDAFGGITVYDIELNQQTGSFTFDLDMGSVKPK